jgi:hypothetical protein
MGLLRNKETVDFDVVLLERVGGNRTPRLKLGKLLFYH